MDLDETVAFSYSDVLVVEVGIIDSLISFFELSFLLKLTAFIHY